MVSDRGGCSKTIAKAHTIGKRMCLQAIAEAGHVYGFAAPAGNHMHPEGASGVVRVGLNRASAFTGFCTTHDNKLFRVLDTCPFTGTPEQCALLAYRAFARELYAKKAANLLARGMRPGGKGIPRHILRDMEDARASHLVGNELGLRDSQVHFDAYRVLVESGAFDRIRALVVRLRRVPDLMAAGGEFPMFDFNGSMLQDIGDPELMPAALAHACIPAEWGGTFALIWRREDHRILERFAATLEAVGPTGLPDAIVRFVTSSCENVFFRPSWWNQLPPDERRLIQSRLRAAADPSLPVFPNLLVDDGHRVVDWSIDGISRVGW